MKALFRGYYSPNKEQFREIFEQCTFVLDANIILNLYRYPKPASNSLMSVLRAVSERLWTPYQVALEYQFNRLDTIAEQKGMYRTVRKIITDRLSSLNNELEKLQLGKRHSAIDATEFLMEVQSCITSFDKRLQNLDQEQADVTDEDVIRQQLDKLFDSKVGNPPTQQWLNDLYAEGAKRYAEKIPPGYMDEVKKDEPDKLFRDLSIKPMYGDLIVWKQILEEAKAKNIKALVFVTDDNKEDWWQMVKSGASKTIGPRPELMEEVFTEAGVEQFWIYPSDRFMQYAKEYLNLDIEDKSIEQAQDASMFLRNILASRVAASMAAAKLASDFSRSFGEVSQSDELAQKELSSMDFEILKALVNEGIMLESIPLWSTIKALRKMFASEATIGIALKSLQMAGYTSYEEERTEDGDTYTSLSLTQEGITFVLNNRRLFESSLQEKTDNSELADDAF